MEPSRRDMVNKTWPPTKQVKESIMNKIALNTLTAALLLGLCGMAQARVERPEKAEKIEKAEKPEKIEKVEKVEKKG
jgi:hypothetical protein